MWKYAPDLDPTTPGIITNITGVGLIPTVRGGYRGTYDYREQWYNDGSSTGFNGSFLGINSSGTGRLFVAADQTTGRIFEATSTGTRTDRSRAGNYTAAAWFTFCQLGDTVIAANKSDELQSATTGAFADVSGSPPKAKICVADENQVVLLNTNSGSDTPDGWACSDVGTTTTWTATDANEARSGRLRDTGGAIVAGCNSPFGGVIAFKKNSMYVGTYVGLPKVRQWRKVSDRVGCRWIEACVNTGEAVYFAGDDVYEFDGSQVRSITDGIRNYIRKLVLNAEPTRVALSYDAVNSLLYVHYNSGSTSFLDNSLVYNTKTGQWGVHNFQGATVNSVDLTGKPVGFITATFDEIKNTLSAPNNNRANVYCWYSNQTSAGWETVSFGGYINASPPSYASMSPSTTTWTTSYVGDYVKANTVTRVIPNIINTSTVPGAVQYAIFSLSVEGKQYTPYGPSMGTDTATMAADYRFHLMQMGHWFKATYTVNHLTTPTSDSNFEWFDHTPEYTQAGKA